MDKNKIFKRYFTIPNLLVGILCSLVAAFLYDYYNYAKDRSENYIETSIETVNMPNFLINNSTKVVGNKIDIIFIKFYNQTKNDINLSYVELSYLEEFLGISCNIDLVRYESKLYDESAVTYDKNQKLFILKGLKTIPSESTITLFIWGRVLKMPNILNVKATTGNIPIFYSNSFGSLKFSQIYIAKHFGIIFAIIALIFIYLYIRKKA